MLWTKDEFSTRLLSIARDISVNAGSSVLAIVYNSSISCLRVFFRNKSAYASRPEFGRSHDKNYLRHGACDTVDC